MIVAGCDTGLPTGLVFLRLDEMAAAQNPLRRQVTWLGATEIARPQKKLARIELDALFQAAITQAFLDYHPELVVLEEPIDARPFWQRQKGARTPTEALAMANRGQDRRGESGETRFRQGVYYWAAASGALEAGARLYSYPVRGRNGEPGWQSKTTRGNLERLLRHDVDRWRGPLELSDHCLMALGVLCYHLRHTLNLMLWP